MKSEITEDEIARAITTVQKNGDKVNSNTLRAVIGHGSYTTINSMLTAHQNALRNPFPDTLPVIPNELSALISRAASAIWQDGLNLVYTKYREAIDSARNGLVALEEESSALAKEVDNLNTQLSVERKGHIEYVTEKQQLIEELYASRGQAVGEAKTLRERNAELIEQVSRLQQMLVTGGKVQGAEAPAGAETLKKGGKKAE